MASVSVDCEQLTQYGSYLEGKSTEFKSITSKMDEIIASIDSGWQGNDASNFKANATAYIKNLKTVEASLAYYGDFIKEKSSKYNNICANFYDMLNR